MQRFGMQVVLAAVVVAMGVSAGVAQGKAAVGAKTPDNVKVMMLSDIHFDPFHDPAKVAQLITTPASGWDAVLAEPSATQAADFAALQTSCHAKGMDTPYVLLKSSLKAERDVESKPLFVTVSGDLMAHQFDCKFFKLAGAKATAADYSAFAAKTVEFVALELQQTFVGVPVYFALGNNDSGCKDYAEDENSAYLQADAKSFAGDALDKKNGVAIASEFSTLGDYSIVLPSPMRQARLIVLQDIFESKKFTNCAGAADESPAAAQIAWLHKQLAAAKAAHEHVWVMAHIPPGVDAYATLSKGANVCAGAAPAMFLGSTQLADTLTEFAGTVSLGLFGHTHMDEMKLFRASAGDGLIAVKLVPSITPVNGNNPAFTVAQVDPLTATLVDYSVYAASNKTGIGTTWAEEYRYSKTYGQPDYSVASVKNLMAEFLADKVGSSDVSHAYQNFYFVGDPGVSANLKAAAMRLVWPGYTCSMTESGEAGFRACVCPAK
jgi:sphingomyelin phosphodiesterase acid-like 3